MNRRKEFIFGLLLMIVLIGLFGLTYASFNYIRFGTNNIKQIVGDIYMHFNDSTTLNIENATPSENYIPSQYYEFVISGKNTHTDKDIIYDINLMHGMVPVGKTESNRLEDKYLRFRFVEVINNSESEIFNDNMYGNLNNRRIYVRTIPRNTNVEITHTYRLYFWIGDNILIGNTDGSSYTSSEWDDIFASIDISVTGNFEEKTLDTPDECFSTGVIDNYVVNTEMTSEELEACVNYFNNDLGYIWEDSENATDFCQGVGTHNGKTLQYLIDADIGNLNKSNLINLNIVKIEQALKINDYNASCGPDVIIPDKLKYITYSDVTFNNNITSEEIETCVNYMTDELGAEVEGDTVDVGETYQAFCSGTGTIWGNTFQGWLDNNGFSNSNLDYFLSHNIILGNEIVNRFPVIEINGYIDEFDTVGAFMNKNIVSVILNDSIKKIKDYAFASNQISSVNLPNNIIYLSGFTGNNIKNITIPNGVYNIGQGAFSANELTNVVIPDSVEDIKSMAFTGNPITHLFLGSGINSVVNDLYSGGVKCSSFNWSQIRYIDKVNINNNLFWFSACGSNSNRLEGDLIIGSHVETIGDSAFYDNNLTSLTIENGVTTIGNIAFASNQLTSVNIPNSVTSIGGAAFSDNQLTKVIMGNSVEIIGDNAFQNNKLSNIIIPNSVTTIENRAFMDNELVSVNIPNSVTTIEDEAFSNNQLVSVTIGNGITNIGNSTFFKSDTSNKDLKSITIDKSCSYIKTIRNKLYVEYPWLYIYSPYYDSYSVGTTIYGSGGEVCDAF